MLNLHIIFLQIYSHWFYFYLPSVQEKKREENCNEMIESCVAFRVETCGSRGRGRRKEEKLGKKEMEIKLRMPMSFGFYLFEVEEKKVTNGFAPCRVSANVVFVVTGAGARRQRCDSHGDSGRYAAGAAVAVRELRVSLCAAWKRKLKSYFVL